MSIQRELERVYSPAGKPGFLGAGHTAFEVVQGGYEKTDPFVLLMDDVFDKKDNDPSGGPHPHAGFETVSLLLEGEMGDGEHKMKAGDLQLMTAGSGVVHTETISHEIKMRLLQLWLILPKKDRWATPRVQDLPLSSVPKTSKDGVDIRLYSGSLAGLSSPLKNYTPLIIADVSMEAGKSAVLALPASYNTFLYILDGSILTGERSAELKKGQTGWLNRFDDDQPSELRVQATGQKSRFVLYSGQPQRDPIYTHGPFIGDKQEDIARLFMDYRSGKMKHISQAPREQKLSW